MTGTSSRMGGKRPARWGSSFGKWWDVCIYPRGGAPRRASAVPQDAFSCKVELDWTTRAAAEHPPGHLSAGGGARRRDKWYMCVGKSARLTTRVAGRTAGGEVNHRPRGRGGAPVAARPPGGPRGPCALDFRGSTDKKARKWIFDPGKNGCLVVVS